MMLTMHAENLISEAANQIAGPYWQNCEHTELTIRLAECGGQLAHDDYGLKYLAICGLWRLASGCKHYTLVDYKTREYIRQATDEDVCRWAKSPSGILHIDGRCCTVE